MQKTAKKFLSMLLALMMVLSILPTAVFATEQGTVAAPLDSIVPYGANDQTTGTATMWQVSWPLLPARPLLSRTATTGLMWRAPAAMWALWSV